MSIFYGVLTTINSFLMMIIFWEKVHHILLERLNRPNAMQECINGKCERAEWDNNFDKEFLKIKKLPPLKEWKKTIKKIFINS